MNWLLTRSRFKSKAAFPVFGFTVFTTASSAASPSASLPKTSDSKSSATADTRALPFPTSRFKSLHVLALALAFPACNAPTRLSPFQLQLTLELTPALLLCVAEAAMLRDENSSSLEVAAVVIVAEFERNLSGFRSGLQSLGILQWNLVIESREEGFGRSKLVRELRFCLRGADS